ncbi:MAG: ABC transporter ATP-binding protein [Bacillota bacterium]
MALVEIQNVSRVYANGRRSVTALKDVSFEVQRGEFLSIMGASGSGKSTLLNVLGCLDRPTEGKYFLAGRDVSRLSTRHLADIRGGMIGFVFQTFNLISGLTARNNVEVPLMYRGYRGAERRRMATAALEDVGIADRADHRPNELSGGEQQRVAAARALVTSPLLILADEPTGNLDSRSSAAIMALFERINREMGVTVIQVTHDGAMASFGERVMVIRDGEILRDGPLESEHQPEPDIQKEYGQSQALEGGG